MGYFTGTMADLIYTLEGMGKEWARNGKRIEWADAIFTGKVISRHVTIFLLEDVGMDGC